MLGIPQSQPVATMTAGVTIQFRLGLQDFYFGFGGFSAARLLLEQLRCSAHPAVFGLQPNGLDLPETVLRLPVLSGKEITGSMVITLRVPQGYLAAGGRVAAFRSRRRRGLRLRSS